MITISVCMIVKNEEKNLDKALKSVESFADEIIIVDTGSSDKTIEIAKKYKSKIYKIWWQNNFAKARNFSFQKAKSDYIFWIDADDEIDKINQNKIIELKKNLDKNINIVLMKYNLKNSLTYFYRERLIKRSSENIWQGFIHEYIELKGKLDFSDIEINHTRQTSSNKRNLKIYEEAKNKGISFSNRDNFYYAKELFFAKKFKKAKPYFKKFLKNEKNNYFDIYDANLCLADCYEYEKNIDKSLELLTTLLQIFPIDKKILCKIASILSQKNNFESAIEYYNLSLSCKKISNSQFIEKYYCDLIPYLGLCECYFKINNIENSQKFHKLAKKLYPDNEIVKSNEQYFKNLT